MTFDLAKILESKRAFRRRLAARPIAEKLTLLDELRERTVSIRGDQVTPAATLREQSPPYLPKESS